MRRAGNDLYRRAAQACLTIVAGRSLRMGLRRGKRGTFPEASRSVPQRADSLTATEPFARPKRLTSNYTITDPERVRDAMFRRILLTGKNDLAGRAMTIICCFAVLITVTAVGSKKVPQPGVRNAINLLGGNRRVANFDMTARATLGMTRLRSGRGPSAPYAL
jgi:hypothetical protein